MSTLSDRTGICTWKDWAQFFAGCAAYGIACEGPAWDYWSLRMFARMQGLA